jgi:thiamine biosynthesis lipoprotein
MSTPNPPARRARPLLGTLVEIGADTAAAHDAGFAAVARVQACMSRFDAASDIGRFNALPAGAAIEVDAWTVEVLRAARHLQASTHDRFDISLGSAPQGWHCDETCLYKLDAACRLDLGGIAKGYAVDRAVDAMRAAGARRGWVNAGGDLRVFGDIELPVMLRDEAHGGVRHFGDVADGAIATSCLGAGARSQLARNGHGEAGRPEPAHAVPAQRLHLSVLAPTCLWADALTKVVASTPAGGREVADLLAHHGAQAWWH